MDKKSKVTIVIMAVVFMAIGGGCLFVGITTIGKGDKIDATITRIERDVEYRNGDREVDYDVYINYTYKGQEYKDVLYSSYSSSMDEGDVIEVQVNPNDPTEFYQPTTFILLGAAFIIIPGIILGNAVRMMRNPDKFSVNGIRIGRSPKDVM